MGDAAFLNRSPSAGTPTPGKNPKCIGTATFGLSALEALASGVPVIGSNAGGLPEVVRDGETGFLCGIGDIPGMSAASLEILKDRKRWTEMSRLASTDARERFARDAIVSKYESLYRTSLPATTS